MTTIYEICNFLEGTTKDDIHVVSMSLFNRAKELYSSGCKQFIEFPRGVLKTVRDNRIRLEFLNNDVLERNIAYSLLLIQTLHWLLDYFNIDLVARQMLYKDIIAATGDIIESITVASCKENGPRVESDDVEKVKRYVQEEIADGYTKSCIQSYLGNLLNRELGPSAALTSLFRAGKINDQLKEKLENAVKNRNKIHLHILEEIELHSYDQEMMEQATSAMNELICRLNKNRGSQDDMQATRV